MVEVTHLFFKYLLFPSAKCIVLIILNRKSLGISKRKYLRILLKHVAKTRTENTEARD